MANSRELTPFEKADLALSILNESFHNALSGDDCVRIQKMQDVLQELIKDLRDTKKIQRIYAVEKPEPKPLTIGLQPR